ncbi:MAG: endonuclease domain-containing protein [Ruminococcus flavefaciens]|nr:endonuclease domain-containing protein [Ruminococcus flavefaciens]
MNVRKKSKKTNLERYGVEYVSQAKSVKEKRNKTNLEKYGFKCSFQNEEVKKKYRENCLEKYGVEYTLQLPKVREKITNTLYKNSSQKASTQQRYLNKLYDGVLNYPIKYFSADICFPDEKIIIEYDGGGHLLNVETGRETQEEHDRKEIMRNNIIKREGYKQIHIISTTDKLPSDKILLQMLFDAKEYFYTSTHTWIEYNIDTSIMRNANNIDGVFFNYGKLRIINKDSLIEREVG